MRFSKFFILIAFLSPIWQGIVINLLTGEDKSSPIGSFFQNEGNKEILYYWITPILLILSLIAAFKTAEKEAESTGKKSPQFDFGKVIVSTLSNFVIGFLLGIGLVWIHGYLTGKFSNNEYKVVSIIGELGVLNFAAIVSGAISGADFSKVYGNSFTGILVGGALGWASAMYIPPDINIPLLKSFAITSPLIAAGIMYCGIQVFAEIFTSKNWEPLENPKLKGKSDKEKFDYTVALFMKLGLQIKSNNTFDFWVGLLEIEMAKNNETTVTENRRLLQEALKDEKVKEEVKMVTNTYEWAKNYFGSHKPPYKVIDRNGQELGSFSTIEGLYEFGEQLESRFGSQLGNAQTLLMPNTNFLPPSNFNKS